MISSPEPNDNHVSNVLIAAIVVFFLTAWALVPSDTDYQLQQLERVYQEALQ